MLEKNVVSKHAHTDIMTQSEHLFYKLREVNSKYNMSDSFIAA